MLHGNRYSQVEIPKRGGVCQKGGEAFSPGMEYCSALYHDMENGVLRRDYCLECWKSHAELEAQSITTWRSIVVAALPEKDDYSKLKRDSRIQTLLKASSDKEEDLAERFILALYLQRRKKLILRSEISNELNQPILLYEDPETEEMIPIQKVSLARLEIDKLQQKIAGKLNGACCG